MQNKFNTEHVLHSRLKAIANSIPYTVQIIWDGPLSQHQIHGQL